MQNNERPGDVVYTLGLSNHEPERVLELLAGQGVTAVADVRSRPYSKYASWFNKAELERLLRGRGLAYVYLGRELGGMPEDPALLGPDNKPDYRKIAASEGFARGLERLLHGLRKGWTICLVCAEADPGRCHRQQLIAPALEARGVRVIHILKHGELAAFDELRADELGERNRVAEQGRLPV